MATSYSSGFLSTSNDVFKPCFTLQLVWCSDSVAIRPRDRRPRGTTLAASAGTGQLQTGAHGISCVERYGAVISESTRSGVRPTKSSPSAVVIRTPSGCSTLPSINSWPSFISCSSLHFLDFFLNFPASAQDMFTSKVIS